MKQALNWLIVLLVAIPLGLECYLVYDGMLSGVTTSFARQGGHHSYAITVDQGKFWFTMAGHMATTAVLAGVLYVAIWLARKE